MWVECYLSYERKQKITNCNHPVTYFLGMHVDIASEQEHFSPPMPFFSGNLQIVKEK